ncbi:exosortase-associated protein EpsI, V-type [Sphingomonas sp. M1-B02]|uniref:exosortase-associated protein EpsI, V-type n=1 Tax=Sphingomonas sp. M1-B02 TaxID=3114300 RepID=UPI00223F19F7|nr:exosortase-associated protein EpsI, V-type [Sphingomonas sp. S6-11]UZK67726.1 EpsI family protein [Sphingomonas sp. S6-11]
MLTEDNPGLFKRRHLVFGGLLAAISAVGYARIPPRPTSRLAAGTLEALVPNRVGDWSVAGASGVVLPPPDALSDRLYDNLVTRVYTSPKQPPIMLLIAYSNVQDGLLQVHRPEFCYTAGGFDLSPTEQIDIVQASGSKVGGNAFVATASARTEQVLYWTRIGDIFPQSWIEQRMAVVRANLDHSSPDGLLARVSLLDNDHEDGLSVARKFIAELDRDAPGPLKKILFGNNQSAPHGRAKA